MAVVLGGRTVGTVVDGSGSTVPPGGTDTCPVPVVPAESTVDDVVAVVPDPPASIGSFVPDPHDAMTNAATTTSADVRHRCATGTKVRPLPLVPMCTPPVQPT